MVALAQEKSRQLQTVRTECRGVETSLDIDSPEDPALIAKLARVAEAGCYMVQSLSNPTPVSLEVSLNGQKLDLQATAKASD